MNMYGDAPSTTEVNELEKQLSALESSATAVVKKIHKYSSRRGSDVIIGRKDVDNLRKSLFIMHYRSQMCSETYFDPAHNDFAGPWIEALQQRHGIDSPIETWLHVFRYYLDTAHSRMMFHALKLYKDLGSKGIAALSKGLMQYDLQHYEALAYYQHNDSYIGFWEAADGDEFVLTYSSFGLCEGKLGAEIGGEVIHRLFVLSPRIIVVLRNVWAFEKQTRPMYTAIYFTFHWSHLQSTMLT